MLSNSARNIISRAFHSTPRNLQFLGSVQLPPIDNEPMQSYEPNSIQRKKLLDECAKYVATDYKPIEVPLIINGKEVFTNNVESCYMPSKNGHKLFNAHMASKEHIQEAIKGSLAARDAWESLAFEHKAAIFLRAADLLSTKYRDIVNAATMMGQAKNMWQAEIDAACEMIDFWRFNTLYASKLFSIQPEHHSKHVWNRLEYRGLEGFIAAISPFNFSSIGGNLCSAPAIMGNVTLWKPSNQAVLSNYFLFKVLQEAGLPDGVIQFVPANPAEFSVALDSPELSGLHFTGSTATFNYLWKKVAGNLDKYTSIPRIVGETGGKNFHLLHETGDEVNFVHQTIRSSFEYQGQKCSACSRAYIPASKWNNVRDMLLAELKQVKVGQPNDPQTFVSAVIDAKSFKKVTGFIDRAKQSSECQIVSGGTYSDKEGYFITPTVIVTTNPLYESMTEEIFGPVLTIYVYEDYEHVLKLVDTSTKYGLTGAIFARDRFVIHNALNMLRHSAGNVYINDKSTGAVVGQQPFGGARTSGTNDKAGSEFNLLRWVSMRSIKETMLPISHWSYPSNKL